MSVVLQKRSAMLGGLLAIAVMATGCGQQAKESGPAQVSEATDDDHDGHNLNGYWCVVHGLPELDCSMCSKKAAAKFKEKGDWCEEHNRAESQCFECDPSRAEKFVKLYEAKFGEKPPEPPQ